MQAYDRVVVPERLVTKGVYSFVQHPIYVSYMLLFSGFCLSLHSAPSALLILAVCAAYYRCVRVCVQSILQLSRKALRKRLQPCSQSLILYCRQRCTLEEALLEQAFGSEYVAYKTKTKRFIPLLL